MNANDWSDDELQFWFNDVKCKVLNYLIISTPQIRSELNLIMF